MNNVFFSEDFARTQGSHTAPGNKGGGRLLRRTFIIALVLVSGGLLTSGAVELFFRYRESVAGIWVLQREMAQGAAFKIQQFVQDLEKTLRASTQTPDLVTAGLTQAYRFQLVKLLKVTPAITAATVLDANGRVQFKESRVEMAQPQELVNYSSDEAFVQARGGTAFFSPVYFVRQSEPYMRIGVPIEPFAGEVIGVLIAEVNLKYIWEVISQIKVGQTGYAYVVSHEGDLIAHPDISLVLQKRNLKNLAQVQEALAGAPGPFAAQPNLAGQQVFPAYAVIPNLGWAVLVERPTAEAYAPLYASILRTSVLLLVGLGMATLASVLISRRVVRPVGVLRQGAARIGAGVLDHRIEVQTGDELEALATEFNRMATQLQESYAGLEQKVEERTHELEIANKHIEAQSKQLAEWNRTLEQRVHEQLAELERVGRLKRFFSPQLAELLVSSGGEKLLESHRREITVVFCDLRGFTAFSETAEPEELMGVLREYHTTVGTLIFRFAGTLEHFAGDGIMIFFNDPMPCPDHEAQAVRMAVTMRQQMSELTDKWRKRGYQLGFGVGIAQGYATLGMIGFEGRGEYGAIGPVANLASRLCDEARGGQILVSQRVYTAVEELVQAEPAGELSLKGFHKPVPTFNVVGMRR